MKKLIAFAGGATFCIALHAAPDIYNFRHYTSRDGLSSNTVSAIIQDSRDLIWVGTPEGLDSFDGRDFIRHALPDNRSTSVQCLFEDSSKTIWIGTDDAVYRYTGDIPEPVGSMPEAMVSAFAEGPDGSMWVGTFDCGLMRLRDNSAQRYLEGSGIEVLHLASDGRLWVSDMNLPGGLRVYNAASDSFPEPGLTYIGCAPARVCAIAEDAGGNLWLGTWDSGVYILDTSNMTVTPGIGPGEGLTHVHSIVLAGERTLFTGSDDGLMRADLLTGERHLFKNERSSPGSLSNKYVYPILIDREGGLWAGTYYGGINYSSPNAGRFRQVSLSAEVGASEDYIASCFAEDPDGSIWVGSDNGGLFRFRPPRSLTRHALAKPYNIHALLRDGDFLWVGTYSDNLLRLNLKTGATKAYGFDEGLESSSIYALRKDASGTLWAGTVSGICRYSPQEDRFIRERETQWISDMEVLPDGTLLAAQERHGILVRSPEGVWTQTGIEAGGITAFPGGVLAGTGNGLVIMDKDGGTQSLLEGQSIHGIVYDGARFWLTTQGELLRYSPGSSNTESYGLNDGINASFFPQNALFQASDGRIYAGTADGFIVFHPGAVKPEAVPPRVLITRVHASGDGIFADLMRMGKTRLRWNFKGLYASFAAPVYSAPEKVRYAYRLEGLDNEWKDIGNRNSISLSRLPAGRRYRLHVRAGNNSGVWSPEEDSFEFSIMQHPLRSNVALAIYILLAVAAAVQAGRKIVGRIEKQSKQQYQTKLDEAVSHVKEEEKGERAQFIGSITDQLEAPVAGIGFQLEKLAEEDLPEPVREELDALENSHRMLRSINTYLRQIQNTLAGDEPKETESLTPGENFLARLNKIIMDNIANPELSVAFLAKEMAISRSSLFTKVSELSGETPNRLINLTRLTLAAGLLAKGDHSVSEVCYMVGFSSPSYFSKIFTTQFGQSPNEWSKRNRA